MGVNKQKCSHNLSVVGIFFWNLIIFINLISHSYTYDQFWDSMGLIIGSLGQVLTTIKYEVSRKNSVASKVLLGFNKQPNFGNL